MKRAWIAMAAGAALLLGGPRPAWAVTEAERAAAKATVEEMFGKQMRQAKASADKDDDLKAAQSLLDGSGNGKLAAAVRAELARTAMDISAAVGTEDAALLADKALEQWASLEQVSPTQRAAAAVDIRQGLVNAAKADRKKELAGKLADAIAALAEAYEQANDLDNAAAQIGRAVALARSVGLNDSVELFGETNQRIQRVRTFNRDMAAAKEELAAAIAGGNQPLIKELNEKIGLLLLLRKGDAVAAAAALTKAGHEWAPQAQLLAKRAAGATLKPEDAFSAAEMLRAASNKADLGVRGDLLAQVLDLCAQASAGAKPGSDLVAKIEGLRAQAKAMLDRLPVSKVNPLKKALEALAGSVQLNPDGTVQISYTFAAAEQVKDFTVAGQWTSAQGQLAAGAAGAWAYHNVRFRADRPLQVTLSATSTGPGAIVLALNDGLDNYAENGHLSLIGANWMLNGFGFERTQGGNLAQPYVVQLVADGAGSFAFAVNGHGLAKAKGAITLAGASLRVGFDGRRGGQLAIRSLVIRGTPVSDNPVVKPAAQAPNPPPPPPPPPQPPPPRRPRGG